MVLKLDVVDSKRLKEAFSYSTITWKYKITTGPRCMGLVSSKDYKSVDSAFNAGNRMIKKLKGE